MRTTAQRNAYRDLYFRNVDDTAVGDGIGGAATPGDWHVSLHTAWPNGVSQALNEAAIAGYGRKAIARSAAKWTLGTNSVSNTDDETFSQITASGPEQVWYAGIGTEGGTAVGSLRWIVPIGSMLGIFQGANTGDLVTRYAHGLVVDNRVALHTQHGQALPAGITEGTIYYVGTAPDANTFTLSTTAANANPVVLTGNGAGLLWKMDGLALSLNNEPKIKAGQLVINFGPS